MGSLAIRLKPETVRTIASAAIDGTFMGVGAALTRPIRVLFLQNLTDVILMFSFDGVNDQFPLPANGYVILDVTANKTIDSGFFLAEGERLYVREFAGNATTGDVYFTTFFGAE